MNEKPAINTDRELYRLDRHDPTDPDNVYSPSVFVTIDGELGIQVGGSVTVMPIELWHKLAIPMRTIKWRGFIKESKYYVGYESYSFIQRIVFWTRVPFAYMRFKKAEKESL